MTNERKQDIANRAAIRIFDLFVADQDFSYLGVIRDAASAEGFDLTPAEEKEIFEILIS